MGMKQSYAAWMLAGMATFGGGLAHAGDFANDELGLLLGGGWADEELVGGNDGDVNPIVGIRYGHRLSERFNFFTDVVGGPYNGDLPLIDDVGIVTGRGGLEWLFAKGANHDWFLSGGLGLMYVYLDENGTAGLEKDFYEPMASVGLGQRWEVGANDSIRWEARADHAFGDGDLPGNELTNYQLLVGYSWGLGTPPDSDGDGVPNRFDQCPGTPEGVKVDEKGCPLDSDGDGVFDGIDQCPNTPAGVKVDAKGCPPPPPVVEAPAPAPEPAPVAPVVVETLGEAHFDFDKAVLKPSADEKIDKAVAHVQKMEGETYELRGYTDSVGSDAYNQKLSQRRADAVRNAMIKKGAPADRLVAKGYGEANPVGDNATKEGRAANRRVELFGRK
jgi:OOP family OmpA-OmpF porin